MVAVYVPTGVPFGGTLAETAIVQFEEVCGIGTEAVAGLAVVVLAVATVFAVASLTTTE
jgi:hypothetical protein